MLSGSKMETVEQQTLAEQESLLAECRLYKGEKEPNTKDDPKESEEADVVTGLPVGPATTVVGAPLPRTPWSTNLFACLGNGDEHFSSDLEVCKFLQHLKQHFFNFVKM